MQITRINKINGYRVFRDFAWPADLLPFARFNLIYGWNGSGKTILASLFRHLQDRSAITEGDVEFKIDNARVSGRDLETAHLPDVRVFDRSSITSTILPPGEQVDPIYYVGEESVEKQKQIVLLKDELKRAEAEVDKARSNKLLAETSLEEFCTGKATDIRGTLSDEKSPEYINYDKRNFKRAIEQFVDAPAATAFLSRQDEEQLRIQKYDRRKPKIPKLDVAVPDFEGLGRAAATLLERSVVSKVIEDLREDKDLSIWVQQGLSLHSGDRDTNKCKFCGGVIPASRLQELRAHFNDAFTSFQSDVEALMHQVNEQGDLLEAAGKELPEPARLYGRLERELRSAESDVRRLSEEAEDFLTSLHGALRRKLNYAFESVTLDNTLDGTTFPDRATLEGAVDSVNMVIEQHNVITDGFQKEFEKTCRNLERYLVAKAYPEYRRLKDAVDVAAETLQGLEDKPHELSGQIAAIEQEIIGHRKPAEELNSDLRSYLGRDELRFEWKDPGYEITRDGQPALRLSESEKTAIAFLYFLKSLQDTSFDVKNGIVVVDDPVSSLDANSLFSAFGFMKERTEDAGQLFILTHNFALFRQVKNWFRHQRASRAQFYMLETHFENGQRSALLKRLDRLLADYESEYHFIFKKVYEEVQREDLGGDLEQYYGMPNIGRRLLETFLAFRYPHIRGKYGHLAKRLRNVDFDEGKKSRILNLLHTYSHSADIGDPEHDLTVLSETRAVLSDLLALIKHVDYKHYNAMEQCILASEVEE